METCHSSPLAAHDEVWSLLPWYANGTLEGLEFAMVQQHLEVCITCRKELAIQEKMAQAIHDSSVVTLWPQPALRHLRGRIARENQATRQQALRQRWRHVRAKYADFLGWLTSAPIPRRTALMLFVLLVVAIATPAMQWLTTLTRAPVYHVLADTAGLPVTRQNEIYAVFADAAGREQIERLLRAVHAEIADGPSSFDVYTLRIATNDRSDRAVLSAVRRLRRSPDVQFAELAVPRAISNMGSNDYR
jgi:anti-sigma factor RsiW